MITLNEALEMVKSVAIVIGALSLVVALRQYRLATSAWRDSHNRARRDRAIEILEKYAAQITSRWAAAVKVAEQLNNPALISLENGTSFSAPLNLKGLIMAALPLELHPSLTTNGNLLDLNESSAFALRWEMLCYLNATEVVFQAWIQDVADQEAIFTEMRGLYSPEDQKTFCARYREVTNADVNYPAIKFFVYHMQQHPDRPHPVGPR